MVYLCFMLSILIPVYNERVTALVEELLRQGRGLGVVFEIVVFDDGSELGIKVDNRGIVGEAEVRYEELPENVGRSAIRNLLGRAARFEYLVFMDGDAWPDNGLFLENYISHLDGDTVLVGGTKYVDVAPPGYELHWLVGSKREVVSAAKRNQRPYHGFSSFNFLVPKKVFLSHSFDETIREYGHEDTLFGMGLQKEKIKLLHLDNPLIHQGLDRADVFLRKRKMAIENLKKLQAEGRELDTKLLRVDRFLGRFGLRWLVRGIYGIFEEEIEGNLRGDAPRLWVFFWWSLVFLGG